MFSVEIDQRTMDEATLSAMKRRVIKRLVNGNLASAAAGLAQMKHMVADPDESALLNNALLFVQQGKLATAIDLLEDKLQLGPALLLRRIITGRADIGRLENLSFLPLDIVAQHLAPTKPQCARQLF